MAVEVKLFNKGLNVSTVSYENSELQSSKSIILKGGQKINISNSFFPNPDNVTEYIPTYENILYLNETDNLVVLDNFSYNKKQISIKITKS